MNEEKVLDVKNISFSYGQKAILEDLEFSTESNQVISILGPNGVGKTTMLKCICGMLEPQAGEVYFGENEVRSMNHRDLAKVIAYVPQRAYSTHTTVFDSVLIGRRPHIEWVTTETDLKITWDVMKVLGLDEFSLRYVDEISGGEFQKVQIARAIVQEPKILILDEPTNNLDIANQHITMNTIINAVRSKKMCTIMTMHDINLAVHYSDKLLFVKNGKVKAYGGNEIVTEQLIKEVYGIDADVVDHKGLPIVIPHTMQPRNAEY